MSDTVWLGLMFMLFSGVCNVINLIFSLFLKVANISTTIISIDKIMNNIYLIISIVMVFYATISFMTYLISPDKITDKTSGGGKLIIKIVITLALLVLTPTLFSLSRDLQSAILHENILGKIILSSNETFDDEKFSSAGHEINKALVKAFIVPQTENAKVAFSDEGDPFFSMNATSMSGLKSLAENSGETDFNFVMAIVSAVILCLILFGFLFDVAIRVVKLLFMELIAPLPILTYPFSKGNNNTFSKWVKETLSTYASVFIRLALIYFVLYCLNALTTSKVFEEDPVTFAFIILGALLFAKQLPKLLQEILGIKTDGNFTLNPMKRIREVPVLGSAVQTAGAAAGGLVTGTALGFKAAGGFKGIGQGFKNGGFIGGMKKIGTMAGMSGRGMIFGGRAGFQQTKLMGVAAKDQKIDKTAYRAGGSAVSKAATGDENASTGFPDSFFNGMSVKLNKPAFDRKKEIENAEKNYTKEADLSAVYKDSQREILSSKGAADEKRDALLKQLNQYDSSRANSIAEAIKNDSNINNLTNELNDVNRELKGFEYTDFASRRSLQEHLLVELQTDLSMEYDLAESVRIKEEINETIDYINKINEKEKEYTTLQTWKTEVENKMKDRRTEVTNQTISNFEQKHGNRDVIERDYNIAESVSANYEKQYDDISKKVVDQEAKTSNAKATLNRLKQEDKDAVGKFKKYE